MAGLIDQTMARHIKNVRSGVWLVLVGVIGSLPMADELLNFQLPFESCGHLNNRARPNTMNCSTLAISVRLGVELTPKLTTFILLTWQAWLKGNWVLP